MPQLSIFKRSFRRSVGSAGVVALCLAAALTGCAQGGRTTMGGPGDPSSPDEQQRARGSIHPVPPGQNMPGGGEPGGGSSDAKSGAESSGGAAAQP